MNEEILQSKIYEVRGQKIMLDFDLAVLYEVETRVLNQSIKRNSDSFPGDFMFKLNSKEWKQMSSQFVMTSVLKRPKTSLPYAFTEHGVTMLASILKSPKARKMNIAIVRAFISLKKFALTHSEIIEQLKELKEGVYLRIGEHDIQLASIYDAIENLLDEKAEIKSWEHREKIGFKK